MLKNNKNNENKYKSVHGLHFKINKTYEVCDKIMYKKRKTIILNLTQHHLITKV
jgi:hypothetical protein